MTNFEDYLSETIFYVFKKPQNLKNKNNLGVSQGPGYPLQSFMPNPGTKGFPLQSGLFIV